MNSNDGEQLENIETLDGQLSGKAGEFERLVERLAMARNDAFHQATLRAGLPPTTMPWDECSKSFQERSREGIRAVLVELAKMGADELPSESDIARAWFPRMASVDTCGPGGCWQPTCAGIASMVKATVKPLLAAKDAELARQAEEIERLKAEAYGRKKTT